MLNGQFKWILVPHRDPNVLNGQSAVAVVISISIMPKGLGKWKFAVFEIKTVGPQTRQLRGRHTVLVLTGLRYR